MDLGRGLASAPSAPKPKPKPRIRKSAADKAASEQEHFNIVLAAAQTTVEILRQHNLPCAIFGSLACKLYGNSRCPKDADILVFPPNSETDAEYLKRIIVATAPRFYYLKRARDPAATYRILWFRQPSHRRESKVDILIPGPMSLPAIPLSRLRWASGLPLAPFGFILLHKLKGWSDHRAAPEGFKRARQSTDAADVRRMLELVDEIRMLQVVPSWATDAELFDAELQADSVVRVWKYCAEFPARTARWRSLGFEVPDPDPTPIDVPVSSILN